MPPFVVDIRDTESCCVTFGPFEIAAALSAPFLRGKNDLKLGDIARAAILVA